MNNNEKHFMVEDDIQARARARARTRRCKMKINIGCGMHKKKGFIRCDRDAIVNPDYCFDCERGPWPFKDDSCEEVLAENILEHLKNIDFFFEEAYRVLKKDGCLTIKVPHFMSMHAYSDPDHCRYFTPESFMYWDRTTTGSDGRPVKRCDADFIVVDLKMNIDPVVLETFPDATENKAVNQHMWNIVQFITAELKPVKPMRNK